MNKAQQFQLPPEADHRWVTLYVRDTHIPEGLPVARRGYTMSDDDVRHQRPVGDRGKGRRRKQSKRR